MVAAYIQAETNVLLGKRVRIGGSGIERDLTHEDLNLIRDGRIGCVPGIDFGPASEPYIRFCFARERDELTGALEAMRGLFRQ